MPKATSPAIVWFRKDLRLCDNRALRAAAARGGPVVALYVHDDAGGTAGALGAAQRWWLHHSLAALGQAIETVGNRLILRSGPPQAVLAALIAETGADALFWNRRYDPDGMTIDRDLKTSFQAGGLEVESFPGQLLHEPSRLKTKSNGPYRVYTPFWRAVETGDEPSPPLDAPAHLPAPPILPPSETLHDWKLTPSRPNWARQFGDLWTPGEAGARRALDRFVGNSLAGYDENRDFPARDATSHLSAHLALGDISPATLWHATRTFPRAAAGRDVSRFRKEIVWREFCYHLLFHFPRLGQENWGRGLDAFPWRDDEAGFDAWTKGLTGYPIVDAGMRQLWQHGTMHNRVRMITASFLVKHLMIDWRRGETWFRDTLVDADPAANAGNWQWVAGCGADASPFFRIFNPILQGETYDAQGDYVRQFVPELAGLDKKHIHRPFEAPGHVLERAGITLGTTYPKPLVDHRFARQRALETYSALKSGD